MTQRDPRIDLAEKLFAAWSSGNPDAPKPYLAPDCVLYDIVGGEHRGWETIRKFFAEHPDKFDPREYLKPARANIKELVKHKLIDVLGCDGKA